ncbi:CBS-domain-containing protein [Eremomyces bilateralis CBS 781.70]|uniref:CBS-domain-containing protein n=1 Tax=Eremomyces bilateralis CBS 781.70 TaxID=1392243 RepID=A0A6G1GAA3_9PEZI|nr:CBS-domain-containing protein [Eremomyces bilateralis CBS 781.70]KAF1814866.1 CBS-domain-containing protein [Eremomyces bilateralis CBS 781.70]
MSGSGDAKPHRPADAAEPSGNSQQAPYHASHSAGVVSSQPGDVPNPPVTFPPATSGVPAVPAPFVSPAHYLRRTSRPVLAVTPVEEKMKPLTPLDVEQMDGLRALRAFLKVRTSYDVLPLSFRLIVFDTGLLVKKSLDILIQNEGIVSAPLWDSKSSTFAGLLTTSDYINVIQYYWQNPDAMGQIGQFRLSSLREVERAIGVQPPETVSIHPERPLYEACRKMLKSRARRIPLVDVDDETQRSMVVSVVTQYRILKFVAVNVKETAMLRKPLQAINVGTYENIQTATMDTPVMDVIHMLVRYNISSVPILDKEGILLNVFEAVDVITLIKGETDYDNNLNLTVGAAILKRADDFSGIYTCSADDRLDTIFDTIRKSRVHRFAIVDDKLRLKGVLTLSDILEYILLEGEEGQY